MNKDPKALKHNSDGERVIRSPRARWCAINVRVDQESMFFAGDGTVGNADYYIGKVDVCFIKPVAHHIESERGGLWHLYNHRVEEVDPPMFTAPLLPPYFTF